MTPASATSHPPCFRKKMRHGRVRAIQCKIAPDPGRFAYVWPLAVVTAGGGADCAFG